MSEEHDRFQRNFTSIFIGLEVKAKGGSLSGGGGQSKVWKSKWKWRSKRGVEV